MLPTKLEEVKNRLEKKIELSTEEKEFLRELRFLDRSEEFRNIIEEAREELKIFSPSSDKCPCCGRSY